MFLTCFVYSAQHDNVFEGAFAARGQGGGDEPLRRPPGLSHSAAEAELRYFLISRSAKKAHTRPSTMAAQAAMKMFL